jgi:hypothetical protein
MLSEHRRYEIVSKLKSGTVPALGLGALAVGMERYERTIDAELDAVASGLSDFKAVRAKYGGGKTFFTRWVCERARSKGFATAEVALHGTATPLYAFESVYRAICRSLSTSATPSGAFAEVLDGWFHAVEQDVLQDPSVDPKNVADLNRRTDELLSARLASVSKKSDVFPRALIAYRHARARELEERKAGAAKREGPPQPSSESLLAFLAGDQNADAATKRASSFAGRIDDATARSFLAALLVVLRDSGYKGLVLVLDEIDGLHNARSDLRKRVLEALLRLVNDLDARNLPGLYVLLAGTPSVFDDPRFVPSVPALATRLAVDFSGDPKFDVVSVVQIRLPAFDATKLRDLGVRIRDIFAQGQPNEAHIRAVVNDAYIDHFSQQLLALYPEEGPSLRNFVKRLVGEVLERVANLPEFDPRQHYTPTVGPREAAPGSRPNQDSKAGRPSAPADKPRGTGAARAADVELPA